MRLELFSIWIPAPRPVRISQVEPALVRSLEERFGQHRLLRWAIVDTDPGRVHIEGVTTVEHGQTP